ncbi:hypothetical protein [Aurantiacibacter poecillastricola]|uniref:hypothetical protein n=1 Tax=Aurantiacibacter poecillastricola TaxID=3064385 RepID=UPI00273E4D20|nr:hypothetical protein [Aurantiacibacter sp. 219JJ12-13]MDP5261070.1 hypothetical protein [Aurantiacibacter sp. 219JJ12-13]
MLWQLAAEEAATLRWLPPLSLLILTIPFTIIWGIALILATGLTSWLNRPLNRPFILGAGAIAGLAFNYFLAVAFFDPDDFLGRNEEQSAWAYSLWAWEMYPLFALVGVICGVVLLFAYSKFQFDGRELDRPAHPLP